MGYYYVLPGNEPKRFVLGEAGLKLTDCKDRRVQVGVPAILADGRYTREYIWVYVLSLDQYKSDNGGKITVICGEALHDMVHEAPLAKDGRFSWETRRGCLPKHNEKYRTTKVVKRTVLRFKKEDIVDVKGEEAA